MGCVMKLKTYIINMKGSTVRRNYMQEVISDFPFMDVEWVEAVDGRKLSQEQREKLFDRKHFQDRYHGRIPLPGEIGCTLSHRICYRKLLDSNEKFVLILEDDVAFNYPEKLESFYKAAIGLIRSGSADMIISVSRCLYQRKKQKMIDGYNFNAVYKAYTTCACLVGREAARKILEGDPFPSMVADDYSALRRMGVTVYEGTYVMTRGLSDFEGNMDSTIRYMEKYENIPWTFRYLKYRIMGLYSYCKILLGILLNRYRDVRVPYCFWRTSVVFVNKGNGL